MNKPTNEEIDKFSTLVMQYIENSKLDPIEAMTEFCIDNDVDVQDIKALLSDKLYDLLLRTANDKNRIKKMYLMD